MGSTIALMFAGQGSQYPRMGAALYGAESVFTEFMDRAFEAYGSRGCALRDAWLGRGPEVDFDDARVAQPLLYAVGHALGQTVLSWGVEPSMVLGHSAGEMVAATLAGAIDFGECMSSMPHRIEAFARDDGAGGMLAVAEGVEKVAPVLGDRVHLAAVNGPRQLLLAGRAADLDAVAAHLGSLDVTTFPVRARQAFHSPYLLDAAEQTLEYWRQASLRVPKIPLHSAYLDGRQVDAAAATDPSFWAYQAAKTVRFDLSLTTVAGKRPDLIVEAGVGSSLTTLARRHPDLRRYGVTLMNVLPDRAGTALEEIRALKEAHRQVVAVQKGQAA